MKDHIIFRERSRWIVAAILREGGGQYFYQAVAECSDKYAARRVLKALEQEEG